MVILINLFNIRTSILKINKHLNIYYKWLNSRRAFRRKPSYYAHIKLLLHARAHADSNWIHTTHSHTNNNHSLP